MMLLYAQLRLGPRRLVYLKLIGRFTHTDDGMVWVPMCCCCCCWPAHNMGLICQTPCVLTNDRKNRTTHTRFRHMDATWPENSDEFVCKCLQIQLRGPSPKTKLINQMSGHEIQQQQINKQNAILMLGFAGDICT